MTDLKPAETPLMTAEDAELAERHAAVCDASVKGWTGPGAAGDYGDFFRRIGATYHALAVERTSRRLTGAQLHLAEREIAALRTQLAEQTARYDEIHREWESACERERAANQLYAAQTEEVARLKVREREALDAHSHSFGALAAISQLTKLEGEVDDYGDVVKAVADALAEAQKDGERMRELLRDVADQGAAYPDSRIRWVDVQIDRDVWADVLKYRTPERPRREFGESDAARQSDPTEPTP